MWLNKVEISYSFNKRKYFGYFNLRNIQKRVLFQINKQAQKDFVSYCQFEYIYFTFMKTGFETTLHHTPRKKRPEFLGERL